MVFCSVSHRGNVTANSALQAAPDVALLVVCMNDTMRSDFSPVRLHLDLDATVGALTVAGSLVVTVRFHDHSRILWLPGPLRRTLRTRIAALNEIIDAVVARHACVCVDLHRMAGAYEPAAWHVDRLHPSELATDCSQRSVRQRWPKLGGWFRSPSARTALAAGPGRPSSTSAGWSSPGFRGWSGVARICFSTR